MSNGKGTKRQNKLIALIVIIIFGATLIFIQNNTPWQSNEVPQQNAQTQDISGELILTMIDVGQADSFLFIQNDKVALVDCGTRASGNDVVEYIRNLGITKLDYVFGTHPHDDHMGGMYDVITSLEIGTIIIPEVTDNITANWYLKLMSELNSGKYNVKYAKAGTKYSLGNATINILGPLSDTPSNLNNYSTIMKISFGQMDVLMTGDAEQDVEEDLTQANVDLDSEILKVGHHGSDTSTSSDFLNAVDPDFALISSKIGNKYEHPSKSTMDKLKKNNVEVYRTDENGTVTATITQDNIIFNSSAGDYLSGVELEERMGK